jgi:hypothetical protein
VRVHADDHAASFCAHPDPPMLDPLLVVEPGGHRYFEPSKPLTCLLTPDITGLQPYGVQGAGPGWLASPLLSLSRPWRRPTRAGQVRATRQAWAADVRATGRAPRPKPGQAPVLGQ